MKKRFLATLLVLLILGLCGIPVSHATLTSTTSHAEYTGTGIQTVFPYPFKIYAASDLKVYLKEAGAYTLQTLNIDYTLSGIGADSGGNVTMTTTPTSSQEVVIFRDPPLLQNQNYVEGSAFPAQTAEDSLDKLVMDIQALDAQAVKSPPGVYDVTLPSGAPSTNGLYLRWNATGTALETTSIAPTYAAGCPVEMVNAKDYGDGTVSFATIQAAKAAIGANNRRLYLAKGDWPVTSNFTLDKNITLVMEAGARLVPDNATLTINGPIEAGPYQIFSWTGTGAIDVSGSPTHKLYAQWWGMTPDDSTDNATAFMKAADGMDGTQQDLHFSKGIWKFSTASAIDPFTGTGAITDKTGFSMSGEGVRDTLFHIAIDVGTDAFTFNDGSKDNWLLKIKGISFVGAENSCQYAVKINRWHSAELDINFFVGASKYALWVNGCMYLNGKATIHSFDSGFYTGYFRPVNGFKLSDSTSPTNYGLNTSKFDVGIDGGYAGVGPTYTQGYVTNGLYLYNSGQGMSVNHITGTVEGCAGIPVYVYGTNYTRLTDIYASDSNYANSKFENCNNVTIESWNGGWYSGAYHTGMDIVNCKGLFLTNYNIYDLNIDGASSGVVVGPGTVYHKVNDLLRTALYIGGPAQTNSTAPFLTYLQTNSDHRNLLSNTALDDYTTGVPTGWTITSATVTRCGTGEGDTTNHRNTYSCLVNTNGAARTGTYTLSAAQLKQVQGQLVSFTMWGKMVDPTPATYASYPYVKVAVTNPDWTASTVYKVGDVVKNTAASRAYKCVVAGTSNDTEGEPAWNTTYGTLTTEDDGVVWKCFFLAAEGHLADAFTTTDLGEWRQFTVTQYIGLNATGASVSFYQPLASGSTDTNVYWAEPCLMVGQFAPLGYVSGGDQVPILPVYADNAAALTGKLQIGRLYKTSAGVVMQVYTP